MCKAENVVKWFADNGVKLDNSLSGNIKINKLLVFSQLMNLVENDKTAFIQKNGKPIAVVLSYERYQRIFERGIDINDF